MGPSYSLSINENYDPDVRTDMEAIMNHVVKEREPYYEHTMEGADDMPAHAKCSLFGVSLTIPITDGKLNLGTWQASTSASSATMAVHAGLWLLFMSRNVNFLRNVIDA